MPKNADDVPNSLNYASPSPVTLTPLWRWSVRTAFLSFLFNAVVLIMEITQQGYVSDTLPVHAIQAAAVLADFVCGALASVHLLRCRRSAVADTTVDWLPFILFILGFLFMILVPTFQKA